MTSALILAAGKATRLEGLRDRYAKANVPVGGTTPLRFLLEAMADAYADVWINLHFKGEQVREEAQRWAHPEVRLHFLEEPQLLGTGGTLLEVQKRFGALPALMVNAKMFTDFAFRSMREAQPGTLILHPSSPLDVFGGLRYDHAGRLLGLLAKGDALPEGKLAAVFTGICRPHEGWIPYLEKARAKNPEAVLCLIRHGLLPCHAVDPDCVDLQTHLGAWCEISTPERVLEAEKKLQSITMISP